MKFVKRTPSSDWSWTALWMEHFGTFVLCYVAGLAVMMNDLGKLDLTGVAMAQFFIISFMVWAGANISGAHYNGAITIALMISRHITPCVGCLYLFAQFTGSILGGCMLGIFMKMYTRDPLVFKNMIGYPHCDLDRFGIGTCILCELFATFILVFMVYAVGAPMIPEKETDEKKLKKADLRLKYTRPANNTFALAIGGALGMAVLSIGPITGAALNPWRVIGPAIITRELFTGHYWYAFVYYLICPLAGALAGGAAWILFLRDEDQCEEEDEVVEPLNVKDDNDEARINPELEKALDKVLKKHLNPGQNNEDAPQQAEGDNN